MPIAGTIEINTYSSSFGKHGCANFGGLATDDQGRWLEGFCRLIHYAVPITAKLGESNRGLTREKEWREIKSENVENHPDLTLIEAA